MSIRQRSFVRQRRDIARSAVTAELDRSPALDLMVSANDHGENERNRLIVRSGVARLGSALWGRRSLIAQTPHVLSTGGTRL